MAHERQQVSHAPALAYASWILVNTTIVVKSDMETTSAIKYANKNVSEIASMHVNPFRRKNEKACLFGNILINLKQA